MHVRDAGVGDLATILAIYNDAVRGSTAVFSDQETTLAARAAWLAERQGRGFPVLVAERDGAVLGFATFGDFRAWPGYRHTVEHSVYVQDHARGAGVGQALMHGLIERAQAQGHHVMVAGIEASNAPSIRLHERLGFERAGLLREVGTKFGCWLDLVFMQKVLAPGRAPE
ncbi:acetyltransferase [Ameyamaea chiangmaiensis NBRC 103196]|uniref:N-acetyltransferase family protein n=1 Tax=Ameyamaea chiangmaiensis TaxID=442969 RepID=A0A850PJ20_9PROT|nr:GNAT family N-acetyltransferase [Ameyamaea chiangmaiensis]MBS4074229.1 N-acetyltransferase [Ameyamaea chiangmaiensis]NVN41271.1 N-acetyltransferase family protein [Ameyamaea chiangmaiensis]GBQ71312.1 acetyltransferase [Ameyamaea chiangmaiensis NBRC 103196]